MDKYILKYTTLENKEQNHKTEKKKKKKKKKKQTETESAYEPHEVCDCLCHKRTPGKMGCTLLAHQICPNIRPSLFYHLLMCRNPAGRATKCIQLDHTPHSGIDCLLRTIYIRILKVYMVSFVKQNLAG